jgi:DNA-directed RNA polymerase beta subunit
MSVINPDIKSFYTDVYDNFAEKNSVADPHINSFNRLINSDMGKIISDYNPIETKYSFIDNGIKKTITTRTIIKDLIVIRPHCLNPDKKKARIYPTSCCISDKTYNMHVYAHTIFELYVQNGDEPIKLVKKINSRNVKNGELLLAKIPAMVMSNYCNLYGTDENTRELLGEDRCELGGYFIIRGKEYYILSQENKAGNFIYKNIETRPNGEKEYISWIQSKETDKYDYPYYTFAKLTKGTNSKDGSLEELISIAVTISKKRAIYIPLTIFYKALGVITDKEIFELIVHEKGENGSSIQDIENILLPSFLYIPKNSKQIKTQTEAILYIAKKYSSQYYRGFEYSNKSDEDLFEYFKYELLNKLFLPHLGGIENIKKKRIFLSHMIRKSINMKLEIEDETDRDNYGNKRILTAGPLYGYLIKYYYNMAVSEYKKSMFKEMKIYSPEKDYTFIVSRIWDDSKLSKIATNISKGEWPVGTSKSYNTKKGMTQFREMKSRSDTVSILERVITPLASDAKGQMFNVHMVQQTNWGVIDPSNTPDGGNIGIVKYKCFLLYISLYDDPTIYKIILEKEDKIIKSEDIDSKDIENATSIFINGSLDYFIHKDDTSYIHKKLIKMRREGRGRMISIVCDYESWEIKINTDEGRCLRPLYIVDSIENPKTGLVQNKLRITKDKAQNMSWDELIRDGCIEYISVHESEYNSHIALTEKYLNKENVKKYTHCEIDETSILSLNSLGIKWIERMQSPRAVYQNTQQKQTIGLPCTNYMYRTDNTLNILCYAEKPVVNTIGDRIMKRNNLPAGNNIIMAIMSYTG